MVSGRLEWIRSAFKITRPGFELIRPGFMAEASPKPLNKNSGFREPFAFKEGLPSSQGVLNNSAKLSLKRGPILKRVQH